MDKYIDQKSEFSTDLYTWEMTNPTDYLYIWKNDEFKIETNYKNKDNLLKIKIYNENEKLAERQEYIKIKKPAMNTIRRDTQRILADELNMW